MVIRVSRYRLFPFPGFFQSSEREVGTPISFAEWEMYTAHRKFDSSCHVGMLESDAHDARFSVQWDALKFSKIPNEVSAGPLVAGTKLVASNFASPSGGPPLTEKATALGL